MALTQVTMPQLGESVTEGTIGKWLKQPGDKIEKYESLAEVITDKVNAEIPSPVAGVIKELKVEEGATVPVGTEILVIDEGGDAAVEAPAPQPAVVTASAPAPEPVPAPAPANAPAAVAQGSDNGRAPQAQPAQPPMDMGAAVAAAMPQAPAETFRGQAATAPAAPGGAIESEEERLRKYSTPAVRRLAEEYNVDISQIKGSGGGGRVTREDLLQYVAQRQAAPPAAPAPAPAAPATPTPAPQPAAAPAPMPAPMAMPMPSMAMGDQVIGLTPMRRAIAEHMVRSVHTSPHAWTSVEIDMTNVVRYRDSIKESFKQREGADITYYAFFLKAVIEAIKEVPMVNATWSDEQGIILKRDINVGVPVDVGEGLIVPVIHGADNYSLTGLARRISEVANKAKAGKLSLEEIQGGTITVNNTGALGTYMTSSIINQPQACLITMESIVKRPVVIDDAIAIRNMTFSAIALDHRVLDGAVGAKFLRIIKTKLESFTPASAGI
jgi:2-oxoisovalerate dehydrogenase E2 component (dihydrolipoyl transacylase)